MAYPNKLINEGDFGTFLAAEAIGLYKRVKFVAGASADGCASIELADAADPGIGVAMTPIASGAYGTIKLKQSSGDQFGICILSIAQAGLVYAAADGDVSSASGGGAILLGMAKVAGYGAAGTIVYTPV